VYDRADYEKDDSNLWVRDMNIDNEIIDCLPVHGATYDRADYEKMTVTFGYVT
jgi:phenylalanyl-tRNA synthetase beta subunit